MGIFNSVGHAVHFSYIIKAYEASPETPLSVAIKKASIENGRSGEPSINFGDLTPLEIRGQCAMVRGAVEKLLPGPESWAIQTKHDPTEIYLENGKTKTVFSKERYEALLNLSSWLAPSFSMINPMAIDILVAKAVCPKDVKMTYRDIGKEFGASKDRCFRATGEIRDRIAALESLGFSRLEPIFVRDGLVFPRAA